MPLPTEQLTPQSSDDEYRRAVAEAIRQCVEEGRDQAQCQAIAYAQAERATGRPYPTQERQARRRGTRVTAQGIKEF